MARVLHRRIAIAVAICAVLLGGAAVALGATGSGHGRHAHATRHAAAGKRSGLVAAAAGYLGVSTSQLRADLRSGRTLAQVAASTGGRSEAGLIAALVRAREARLTERVAALVKRSPKAGLRGAHEAHGGKGRSIQAAALAYLGIDRATMRSDLQAGRSLTQIAESVPGKSPQGLSEAILSAASQRLTRAAAHHAH